MRQNKMLVVAITAICLEQLYFAIAFLPPIKFSNFKQNNTFNKNAAPLLPNCNAFTQK